MTTTASYGVTGMTCNHCVQAVRSEVCGIPGVRDVEVELVTGGTSTVRVVSETPLADEAVREAVDEAGYRLVGTS